MIRGSRPVARALAEACRILQPGGRLALHAHNCLAQPPESPGPCLAARQALKIALGHPDAGDRRMAYRCIPGMEVHLYRWRELRRDLQDAGFQIDEVLPLDAVHSQPIPTPWLFPGVCAGGWIVFAATGLKALMCR